MPSQTVWIVLSCAFATSSMAMPLVAQSPSTENISDNSSYRSVEYWVEQLSSDHYLRRETAQKRLIQAGNDAVPALEKVLGKADLETTELAIRSLGEIALAQRPDDDSGAWAALDRISTKHAGSKASRAKLVVDDVNEYRSEQAREAIVAAGVFIGTDEFVVQAIAESHLIIQIDDSWRGDLKALDWLRWVRGVRFARVVGKALNHEVLSRLVKMPDLKTISLMEGNLDLETIVTLQEMPSIHSLELRYIPVDESIADAIQKLPLRSSLSLIGTDLPRAKVDAMRLALPGLKIEYKQGGFLGVNGNDGLGVCQINRVLPGSAAENAGLRPGDAITKIGDTVIRQFSDLQAKIGEHNEGDSLDVEFDRNGRNLRTTVVLGKQTE